MSLASDLKKNTTGKNQSYREFTESLKVETEKNEEYKTENSRLLKEINQNRTKLRKELTENNATMEQLNEYVETRNALQKHNLGVENLSQIITLIKNFERQGNDPIKIIKLYLETVDVEANLIQLGREQQKKIDENQRWTSKNADLKEQMDKNSVIVDQVNQLTDYNLTPEMITILVKTISKIGAGHGKTEVEAVTKFTEDIKTDYDPILGFESRRDNLKRIVENLDEAHKQKQEAFNALKKVMEERQGALDSLNRLKNLKVSDENLQEWDRILKENNYDVVGFRIEIEKLHGVEATVKRKTAQVTGLEQEIDKLTQRRNILETDTEAFRKMILYPLNEFLETIENETGKLSGVMEKFEEDFNNPETGFQARSNRIISVTHQQITGQMLEIHRQITALLRETETEWGQSSEELKTRVAGILENTDKIMQNAYKGGKIVGQFHSLEPITKLFLDQELDPFQATLAVFTVMSYVKRWFNQLMWDIPINMIQHCDAIINYLAGRLNELNP